MGLVESEHVVARPRLAQSGDKEIHHLGLLAAKATYGKKLHQKFVGVF